MGRFPSSAGDESASEVIWIVAGIQSVEVVNSMAAFWGSVQLGDLAQSLGHGQAPFLQHPKF